MPRDDADDLDQVSIEAVEHLSTKTTGWQPPDIIEIVQAVMLESARATQRDLETLMSQVKGVNAEKRKVREVIGQLRAVAGVSAEERRQLKALQDTLKAHLDALSELSEMTSLRLQTMLDRRSKFISTLCNIMKKVSETRDELIKNLK